MNIREEQIKITCSQCQNEYLRSRRSIKKSIKKYNTYKCHKCVTSKNPDPKWRDKAWLESQIKSGNNIEQIASIAGCSISCLSIWAKKFNLKFNIYNKLKKTGFWDNPKWLRIQHWDNKRSVGSIAKEVGLSSPNLLKRFRFYGIAIRSNKEATRLNAPNISNIMKKAWENPKHRDSWMKARCEAWQNTEYVEKFSQLMAHRWESDKYRHDMSLQSKRLHQNPEYVRKKLNSLRGKNKSVLEDVFAYFLDEIELPYKRHVIIGKGVALREFDFELGDGRLIEIDGTIPHIFPQSIGNDAYKNILCKKLGRNLIRIPEEVFYDTNLFNSFCRVIGVTPKPITLDKKTLKIEKLLTKECKPFFRLYHYLHNCGRYGRSFAIKDGDHIVCAALISTAIRKESATSLGLEYKDVKEIARFVISPRYKIKNLGSWFLSRIMKSYVNEAKAIISFADPAVGHTGALYKSINMDFVGPSPVDYWYEDQNGIIIHKKTLWNRMKKFNKDYKLNLTEIEYAIRLGAKRYYYPGKLKFIKYLK